MQNGICPYLGLPITIGLDAELDHIIPRSKGGTDDIENLQWVHVWANVMKGDDWDHEFKAKLDQRIPSILSYLKKKEVG